MATATMTNKVVVPKKHKEIKFGKTSEIINVSADALWEIIGPGFERAGEWSTAVDHSSGEGKPGFEGATCEARHCDLNARGFNKVKEVITTYNEKTRTFAFDVVEGLPDFVHVSNSHWQVIEVGPNQSKVQITISIKSKPLMGNLMGGMLKANIKKIIPGLIRDLKVYAETGEVSQEKKDRMAKLDKKSIA